MKKTNITVVYDEEKCKALKIYLDKKDMSLDKELTRALDTLYNRIVPNDVRKYLEMVSDDNNAPTVKRVKKITDTQVSET